jgi:hypothetical protein
VLRRDQLREVVHVGCDEFAEFEQHGGALGQGNIAPGIRGGAGRRHGGIQVGTVREAQLRGDPAGGGVVNRAGAGALAGSLITVDEMVDRGECRRR